MMRPQDDPSLIPTIVTTIESKDDRKDKQNTNHTKLAAGFSQPTEPLFGTATRIVASHGGHFIRGPSTDTRPCHHDTGRKEQGAALMTEAINEASS